MNEHNNNSLGSRMQVGNKYYHILCCFCGCRFRRLRTKRTAKCPHCGVRFYGLKLSFEPGLNMVYVKVGKDIKV